MSVKSRLVILLLFIPLGGFAQLNTEGSNAFKSDVNGRPLSLINANYKIDGSPYYFDQYMPAEVTTMDGKVYRDVQVKINLLEHELAFLTADGKEMVSILPVKKVRFLEMPEGAGKVLESYGQPINAPDALVYEVVDTGRCTLLKLIEVSYHDSKESGHVNITRIFQRTESFHVLWTGEKVERLGSGKEAMAAVFKDKEAPVRSFIAMNRLKCRSAADYKKVVGFYNSLF
jgi:hypothetical protein